MASLKFPDLTFSQGHRRSRRGSEHGPTYDEPHYIPVYTSSLDEVSPLLSRDGQLLRPAGVTVDESQQGGAPVDSIDDWEADNLEKQKSNLSLLEAEVAQLREELKEREQKGFDVSKLQSDLQQMADEVEKERRYIQKRSTGKEIGKACSSIKKKLARYRNLSYYTILICANFLLVWWIWASYHVTVKGRYSPTVAPTTTLWKMESDGMESTVTAPSPASISIPSTPTAAPPSYSPTPAADSALFDDYTTETASVPTDDDDGTAQTASALTPAEIAEGDPMAGVASGEGSVMPSFDDDSLSPQQIAANDPNKVVEEDVEEETEEDVEEAVDVEDEEEDEATVDSEVEAEKSGGWASVTHKLNEENAEEEVQESVESEDVATTEEEEEDGQEEDGGKSGGWASVTREINEENAEEVVEESVESEEEVASTAEAGSSGWAAVQHEANKESNRR